MGWNSFDCFGSTVTEAEVLENARFVAEHLLPFGWDHVVVDYCWSHPNPPPSTNPNQLHENQPYLHMDSDFRLLPAVERFPSSAGGKGFAPLAEKIHAMGLKFGIHIMRGFPRQGLYPGYPARNLKYRPKDMANPMSECPWLNHMVGVKLPSEAGQAYYNSLFELYASWGVDFVKADDITFPYRHEEIEAIDRARKACGRPMMLSLSPGPCEIEHAAHVSKHAELWRICADFWDDWGKLKLVFNLASQWAGLRSPGCWPDADMLPLGRLSKRGPVGPEHDSFLSHDEQVTLMSLWCLFRSPLFMGGNLPETSDETLALLTNPEVLAVHRDGKGGHPLHQDENAAVWISEGDGGVLYLGLFNLSDIPQEVGVDWDDLGFSTAPETVRNLWEREDSSRFSLGVHETLPAHGAALYSLQFDQQAISAARLGKVDPTKGDLAFQNT